MITTMAIRLDVMPAGDTIVDDPHIRSIPEPRARVTGPINPGPHAVDRQSGQAGNGMQTPYDTGRSVLNLCEGERWYVVHTQTHREFGAQTQLAAQGFRTFLPLHRKTVRHARKLRTVSAPFFPRYLFVALDLSRDRWRSVNGTFGVAGLVMGDEFPVAVPSGVVEGLGAACTADGHLRLGETLGLGDRVRVLSGPFADLVGELARIDGAGRVTVLLRLLGGEVPVSIPRVALMPVRAA
jgi:transcription elongation factor/antiterminator RfaH